MAVISRTDTVDIERRAVGAGSSIKPCTGNRGGWSGERSSSYRYFFARNNRAVSRSAADIWIGNAVVAAFFKNPCAWSWYQSRESRIGLRVTAECSMNSDLKHARVFLLIALQECDVGSCVVVSLHA